MADNPNQTAPKPAAAPAAPVRAETVLVEVTRDYWPRQRPDDLPDDVEYRVRVGERVDLPVEEAMDVVEAGVGLRVRREDILKG